MKDVIVGILCLLFSTWVYVLTMDFPQTERVYKNPASYPRVLIFLLLLFGIILGIKGIKQLRTTGLEKGGLGKNFRRPLTITVLLIGYFTLLYLFGFLVATFIFLILVYHIFGGSLKTGLVFSALLTLGEYVVFGVLLKVPLPQALFW